MVSAIFQFKGRIDPLSKRMIPTKRKPLRERPLVGKNASALARVFIVYV